MTISEATPYRKEKIRIAKSSVFAAILLTGMKLGVGLWTGSLGILSEAAHSGLDLIAALMTWFSVSVSDLPADENHPYGHSKIDNLSALFETVLLLATCIWIIYEAFERLFFKPVHIEVNIYSFGVIIFAIIIDYTRGMALSRIAKKSKSAALEADAFHFLSDIASSLVVLAGLAFTMMGYPRADAICSMAVAVLVIWISFKLGRKAIAALTDSVPREHIDEVRQAALKIPGVRNVYDVRVRHSGERHFIDLKVGTDHTASIYNVHELTDKIEETLKTAFDNADVLVHAEPDTTKPPGLTEAVFLLTQQSGINVHSLQLYNTGSGLTLDMHLEWPSDTHLGDAHREATAIEEKLHRQFPDIAKIHSHLECCSNEFTFNRHDVTVDNPDFVHMIITSAEKIKGVRKAGSVQILEGDGRWYISLICKVDEACRLEEAHQIATAVEASIGSCSQRICSVIIHTEPYKL